MIGLAMAMLLAASGDDTTAVYKSGRQLKDMCQTDRVACENYIIGAADAAVTVSDAYMPKPVFCLPDGGNIDRSVNAVIAYLRSHPDQLESGAAGLVVLALRDLYPCAQSTT